MVAIFVFTIISYSSVTANSYRTIDNLSETKMEELMLIPNNGFVSILGNQCRLGVEGKKLLFGWIALRCRKEP